ncbi:hypothetical protein Rctr71_098 [Virus Rctr71]|nr:hypothetical protein Rctr71_098 [Virus Rctr71]
MYSFYTEPMVHNNATPVDGDDYTWDEKPVIPLDNTELTKMIFRLRDLNTALQSENHALRQRIEKIERTLLNWTGEG